MPKFEGLTLWTDKWVSDTAHLTRAERGTYMDLLILMWRSPGCTVPDDDAWLARQMRMTAVEVVMELRPLIREFCKVQGSRISQKRLLMEHERVKKVSAKFSALAKSRQYKEKDSCVIRNALESESESESESKQENKKERKKKTLVREVANEIEFEQFWMLYPRHVGRPKAVLAFARARKGAELDVILAGLRRQLPAWAGKDPQYIPHPTTWLNRAGWEDDAPPPTNGGDGNGHRNLAKELAAALRREEREDSSDGSFDFDGGAGGSRRDH